MSPYLADIALRPAVLRRPPRSQLRESIEIGVKFTSRFHKGPTLALEMPVVWEGKNGLKVAHRRLDGGFMDPGDLTDCHAVELDLTPRGDYVRALTMEGPKDLAGNVGLLREVTKRRVPVWIRMPCGDIYDDLKLALKASPDAILLDPYATPGLDIVSIMAPAARAFQELNLPDDQRPMLMVAAVPPVAEEPTHLVKLLALGADMIYLVDPMSPKSAGKLKQEIIRLVGMCGHNSLSSLSTEDLYALSYDAAAVTGLRLAGYDSRLPIWSH